MFRNNIDDSIIEGLLGADDWLAEKVATDLLAIAHDERFFALDELLGWYGDAIGANTTVESALTRLASIVVSGELELIANAVRDAIRLRRAYESHRIVAG